jgi:hypothetical protein
MSLSASSPADVPLPQRVVAAAVDGLYKGVGQAEIKATGKAAELLDADGNGAISKAEMKAALSTDRVVLSLGTTFGHTPAQQAKLFEHLEVTKEVAGAMDRADGKASGLINLTDKPEPGPWTADGDYRDDFAEAAVARGEIVPMPIMLTSLATNERVLGRSFERHDKAASNGKTIVQLDLGSDGPTLTVGE